MSEPTKTQQLLADVESAKQTMQSNIVKIVANTNNLENLEDKVTDLERESKMFKTKSTDLKRSIWWKNLKIKVACAIIALIIITVIIVTIVAVVNSKSN
jgi:hypothetical protein